MLHRLRALFLSLMIVALLVFSAVGTTVAYADGGTTTETAPTTETSNDECKAESGECPAPEVEQAATEPAAEAAQPDAAATAEPVEKTETAPTEVTTEESAPVEEAATPVPTEEVAPAAEEQAAPLATEEAAAPTAEVAPATETTAPAETALLDAVPDNTTVTVLNAEGESQPLATQDVVDAIATSDPIWCPQGQAPTPGANGCTQSFTSFDDLLTFLQGNTSYAGAGTIYVQQGNYQGGESTIDFNNYNLTNINNADLTITGGWNTTNGAIDPTTSSTFNNISIVIGSATNPWGGSLTLNNLILTNPTGTGITLNTQGNILLDNVSVTNSTNGAGAELNAGGSVTIDKSKFERNKTAGAIIRSLGSVAISNTNANSPANARRQITGLDIVSDGSVSLFNVLADQNREAGATIDAAGMVTIVQSVFSGTKAIKGSDFLGYGLTITTPDAIVLDTVTANDNFLWGASLTAGGDVTIQNSIFNANTTESDGFIDDTGLLVTSGGKVSINNTQANDNRLIGATINATGDVSINNSSFSSNNGITLNGGQETFHGYGLEVITLGNIFVNNVKASDNTLFGARLDAGMDVIVSNSDFSNQTSGNATDQTGRGLEIISDGNVFLDTVTINNNQTFGANIQAGGDVFLENVTATNNGGNGLEVQASCTAVYLINGTFSNNGQYGLSVLNAMLNQSGAPVFLNNVAGNIFQDPGTCVFTTPTGPIINPGPTNPGTPVVPSSPAAPQQASASPAGTAKRLSAYRTVSLKSASGTLSANNLVTLNSFVANTRTLSGALNLGLFTGQYAYVYSSDGILMQIVVFSPGSLNEFAWGRS